MDAFDAKQWSNYNFDVDSGKKPWQNYNVDANLSVSAKGKGRSIFAEGKSSDFAGFGKTSDSADFSKDDSGSFKADFGHAFGRKKDIWARDDDSDDDDGGFIERETDDGGFTIRPQVGGFTIRPPKFTIKPPIEESKNLGNKPKQSGSVIKKPCNAELQMGFRSLKPVSKVDLDAIRVESVHVHQGLAPNAKSITLSPLPKPPRRDLKVKKIDTFDRIEVDENFYMQKSDGFLMTNASISGHGTRSPFKRLEKRDFEKEISLPKMTLHCRDSEMYNEIISNVTDDESNSSKSFENNFDFHITDSNKPINDDNRGKHKEDSEGLPEPNKSFLYPGKENTLKSQTGQMENFNTNQNLRENVSSPQELQESSTKTFGMGKFMRKKHKANDDTTTDVRNDATSGFDGCKSPIPSIFEPDVIFNSGTDLRNTKSPDSISSGVFKSMINNFSRFSKRRPKMDENQDEAAIKRMKINEKGITNESHHGAKSSNVIGEITKKFPIKLKRKEKRMAPMAPLGNMKRGSARFEIKTYSEEHNNPTNNKSDVCTTAKTKINWFQKQLKQFESDSEQGSARSSKNSFKVSKNKVSGLTKEFDRVANTESLPNIEHKSFSLPCNLQSQHCLYESEMQINTRGRNVQVYSGTVSDRVQRFSLISEADGSQQKGSISELRPTQKMSEKVEVKTVEPRKKEIKHQPYHMQIEIEDYI